MLGLVILTVVSGIAAGGAFSPLLAAKILAVAIGFLVVAIAIGGWVAPRMFRSVARMKVQDAVPVIALAICFALAALADLAGSALIMGAFAAGVILARTEQFHAIVERVRPVGALLTPIFFVSVGSALDIHLLDPTRPGGASLLLVALGLTVLAILGKVAAGFAVPWARFRRLAVGVGMVPRGEVGLIFADIGRRSGLLTDDAFSVVLLMVMGTTFVAPPLLKLLFRDPTAARGSRAARVTTAPKVRDRPRRLPGAAPSAARSCSPTGSSTSCIPVTWRCSRRRAPRATRSSSASTATPPCAGLGKGADRPLVPEAARARLLAGFAAVDCVALFDEDTPLELIRLLEPDVLVKGADYTRDRIVGADLVEARGGRVVRVELVPDHSTTRLVERLRASS